MKTDPDRLQLVVPIRGKDLGSYRAAAHANLDRMLNRLAIAGERCTGYGLVVLGHKAPQTGRRYRVRVLHTLAGEDHAEILGAMHKAIFEFQLDCYGLAIETLDDQEGTPNGPA